MAKDIELDTDGNVLISGSSEETTKTSYLTVKYSKHGIIIPPDDESVSSSYTYIENRGQIVDTAQNQVTGVKFYNQQQSPSLYFFDDQISFVVSIIDTSASTQDTMHRIDMGFVKSGRSYSSVMPINRKSVYNNYYLGHIPEGREDVPLFERLVYPNVYDNIDLMLSSNGSGAKYYFICKPGSDPDSISLNFTGQSGLNISNNDLHIETALEDIVLSEASAFQINGSGNSVSVSWTPSYSISGGEVNITTGTYNTSLDLVIQINSDFTSGTNAADGNLEWSAWLGGDNSGGFGDDHGMDVQVDASGNPYVLGTSSSTTFPTTSGALQENLADHFDAFLTKFDIEAKIIWSTYYGGSRDTDLPLVYTGDDRGISLLASTDGTIYFAGVTQSLDFPLSDEPSDPSQYYQNFFGGERDAYIVQLNTEGQRLWSTLFGGYTNDAIYKLTEDGLGNLIFAGEVYYWTEADPNNPESIVSGLPSCTEPITNNGFPSCDSGGFIDGPSSANSFKPRDGFIAKFNSNKELSWSTFFGGNRDDVITDVLVDPSDNSIYATGYSTSFSIGNNSQVSPCDASTDNRFNLCDLGGNSYFQNSISSSDQNSMAFIAKFDKDDNLLWSTYFGSQNDNNEGHKLGINSSGELYLVGISETSASMPNVYCAAPTNGGFPLCDSNTSSTNDYYEDKDGVDDGIDVFISKFGTNLNLTWSTFLGGDDDEQYLFAFKDDGTADIEIDYLDNVYILANSEKSSGSNIPTVPFSDFYVENHSGENGTFDAIISSFDVANSQFWMTYYGGSGSSSQGLDKGHEFVVDNQNMKLYVTGLTKSSTFPEICPSDDPDNDGTHCPSSIANVENSDAFIARFNLDYSTSIDHKVDNDNNLLVFPNPTEESIFVSFDLANSEDIKIMVTDVLGVTAINSKFSGQQGINLHSLSLKTLPPGTYFLSVIINEKTLSRKILKIN